MEESYSLLKDSDSPQSQSINIRIIITMLAFSMNPLLFTVSIPIINCGLMKYLFFSTILNILFFYMYYVIINGCIYSRANTFAEILNNYFHKLDKVLGLCTVLYCMTIIVLCQMTIIKNVKLFCINVLYVDPSELVL